MMNDTGYVLRARGLRKDYGKDASRVPRSAMSGWR